MTRYILTDGAKSIDLPQYPDAAWEFRTNPPDKIDAELYARVAPVFRAVNLDANVSAGVPFALVDVKTGEDYDTSMDWQNKVGFLPNPDDLFRRWFMSLSMTNSAYGFMERGPRQLRYIVPTTITPNQSKAFPYGLESFTRRVGTESRTYPVKDKAIVYIWKLDHTTELLPSQDTEFKAMMSAAGILYWSDFFVENYFARGGIRPTIVALKGQIPQKQAEDAETAWDKFVRNVSRLRAKVINADFLEIKPFGDGVSDIQNSDTFREQCQKIAMAKGMPLSMLLSDYDNYSTAQVYDTAWFRDDIFPKVKWFAHELNDQLWTPLGLHMEYRPEQTDEGTQDEVDRAAALNTLGDALSKYPDADTFIEAAKMLGFELTDELISAVKRHYAKKEEPAEIVTETPAPAVLEGSTDTMTEVPQYTDPTQTKFVPNPDQMAELNTWKALAFRKYKRGDPMLFPWDAKSLPGDVADTIHSRLGWARNHDEIKAAFDLTGVAVILPAIDTGGELRELARALNDAAAAMKAAR